MQKLNIKIEGVKPFLFHKFNIESLQSLSTPNSGSAGNNPEEWKTSFFHNKGRLYVPSNYIFSPLKNGSVHTKLDRGTLQKNWISAVQVVEYIIYMNRTVYDNWEE